MTVFAVWAVMDEFNLAITGHYSSISNNDNIGCIFVLLKFLPVLAVLAVLALLAVLAVLDVLAVLAVLDVLDVLTVWLFAMRGRKIIY